MQLTAIIAIINSFWKSDWRFTWLYNIPINSEIQLLNFSPLCVFLCILKMSAQEEAKSYWLHLFDFSPLCTFQMCLQVAWMRRCIVILVAVLWLSPTVGFHMHPQITCPRRGKLTLVAFIWLLSNVSSNRLPESKQSHIDCICLTFLHYVLSDVCFLDFWPYLGNEKSGDLLVSKQPDLFLDFLISEFFWIYGHISGTRRATRDLLVSKHLDFCGLFRFSKNNFFWISGFLLFFLDFWQYLENEKSYLLFRFSKKRFFAFLDFWIFVFFGGICNHISGTKSATGDPLVSKRPDFGGLFSYLRGSHGLNGRRAQRTKSRGPKGPQLKVGAQRVPRLLVC